MTPTLASPGDQIARRIAVDLWTRHDEAAIAELFTEDALYRDVAFDLTFRGHDGIAAYLRQVTGTMADFAQEIVEVIDVGHDVLAARWFYSGTFRLGGVEQRVRLPGVSIIAVRDGKVESNLDHYSGDAFVTALRCGCETVEDFKDWARGQP